jgi:RNA polymerase sigma factor (sigma-70 family)
MPYALYLMPYALCLLPYTFCYILNFELLMRPRQDLVEIFSTFVQFDADVFNQWVTDPKLRRSMHNCLNLSPEESSDTFWALYWHRVWQAQANSLAAAHVTAYLQEVCYWVAKKLAQNLAGKHSIADFFQTAIARVNKILKGFNPKLSSNLKGYAELIFRSTIKKLLYQQQVALQTAGVNRDTIARYVLAWNCFKELYAPADIQTAHKLIRPNEETWQAIAHLYNTQRLSQLSSPSPPCSPESVESWLLTCAKAVRSFQFPTLVSVDAPSLGQETGNLLDTLPESDRDSLLATVIAREEAQIRESQIAQIKTIIADALAKLDDRAKALLKAYYQQGLTQQQIAQQLGVKQYTVSRQLSQIRQKLLLTLAQWSQQTLHIKLTSEVLDSMSNLLEEWLNVYYCSSELHTSQESP